MAYFLKKSFFLSFENLNLKKLQDKKLLSDDIASAAATVAKDKKIRQLVLGFQRKIAYSSPSCLDGRDICSFVVKDADFKFYITANYRPEDGLDQRFLDYLL